MTAPYYGYDIDEDIVYLNLYNNDSSAHYYPDLYILINSSYLTGTYTSQNENISPNSIIYLSEKDSSFLTNVQLKIESTDDIDVFKITGSFDANGKTYFINYEGFGDDFETYGDEINEKVTKNLTLSDAMYVQRSQTDQSTGKVYKWIDVYFNDDEVMLEFWVDPDENTILPIGTYPLAILGTAGSSTASPGLQYTFHESLGQYVGYNYPDFVISSNEQIWWLRKGTIDVALQEGTTKGVVITGKTTSYYGSTINFTYQGRILPYSSSASAPQKINNLNPIPKKSIHSKKSIRRIINPTIK